MKSYLELRWASFRVGYGWGSSKAHSKVVLRVVCGPGYGPQLTPVLVRAMRKAVGTLIVQGFMWN